MTEKVEPIDKIKYLKIRELHDARIALQSFQKDTGSIRTIETHDFSAGHKVWHASIRDIAVIGNASRVTPLGTGPTEEEALGDLLDKLINPAKAITRRADIAAVIVVGRKADPKRRMFANNPAQVSVHTAALSQNGILAFG